MFFEVWWEDVGVFSIKNLILGLLMPFSMDSGEVIQFVFRLGGKDFTTAMLMEI